MVRGRCHKTVGTKFEHFEVEFKVADILDFVTVVFKSNSAETWVVGAFIDDCGFSKTGSYFLQQDGIFLIIKVKV